MKQLDLRNRIFLQGKAHFAFGANNKRIAYAYIRKNACSAFKDLICGTSDQATFDGVSGSELNFMNTHHRIKTADRLADCEECVFVYRDPFERAISVFVNKFVVWTGNGAIFKDYEAATGANPEDATFETFLNVYCRTLKDRNQHVQPQSRHLIPIRYTAALSLNNLRREIVPVIGEELAERYFAHKVNASTYGDDHADKSMLTARELNAHYKATNVLPSKHAFMRDDLIELCKCRYAVDYDLIAAIGA
jgi:hypothetical protein